MHDHAVFTGHATHSSAATWVIEVSTAKPPADVVV